MRSSSTPETYSETEIQAIDELFERAGLRRNLRGNTRVTLRMRFARSTQVARQ